MNKTYLLFFVFSFFYPFLPETNNCFSQSQFQVVIGDSSETVEVVRSIIQTTDGGFIAVGQTEINGDMYIVKLNSTGQLQWNKTIGGSGTYIALSVVQTFDGGYVLSGFGNPYSSGIAGPFIVKLSQAGTIEWARLLTSEDLGAAYSIIQTNDGGYATAVSFPDGGGTYRMIIVKLNNMGIIQWSKDFGSASYTRCIKQTSDGGYVLAGAKGGPALDMFIVKLDSTGTLLWAKTIGGAGDEFAYSITQTTDGGFAVAGYTDSFGNAEKVYIVKLDSSGMLQWTKVLAINSDLAYSIVQTTDGGYAVAGYTGAYNSMLIIKLNPDGSLQWSRVLDGGFAYSIEQTTDGGYAAAGFGGILGATGMFIVKFDNNGNTCANTISHSISVDSGGTLGSPIPVITNLTITDTLFTPLTGTHGFVTPICVIGIQSISNEIPASYKLYQNYPNPFNPTTKIKFSIPYVKSELHVVRLNIYDISGKLVKKLIQEILKPGSYEITFDALSYSSGVYFYKLETNGFVESKKMVLIK